MMTKYDVLKQNAKHFDMVYIQSKERLLYCDSERIIIDYLIMKANITPNMSFGIIIKAGTAGSTAAALYERALIIPDTESNLDCINLMDKSLRFINGSVIRTLIEDLLDPQARGLRLDIAFLTNPATFSAIGNGGINILHAALPSHGRIIYNFDL